MRNLTAWVIMITVQAAWLVSCASSSGVKSEEEWKASGQNRTNSDVVIYINHVDVRCRLVQATSNNLTVMVDGKQKELPTEIVSRILFPGSKKKRTIIGASIGTLLGGVAGFFAGDAINEGKASASDLGHPVSMLLIIGGGASGAWLGNWGSGATEYQISQTTEPYQIHEALGQEITPSEIKMYGLFEGLVTEDDQLLQVQVFKLSNSKYFLLMDVRRFGEYAVDWMVVDDQFIATQREKIK